jgi:hypothetical protein
MSEKAKAERLPGIAAVFQLTWKRQVEGEEIEKAFQAIGKGYLYRESEAQDDTSQ